jgi:exopolysaccharide biosynthesis predicted pyruvyltransferase EpsI
MRSDLGASVLLVMESAQRTRSSLDVHATGRGVHNADDVVRALRTAFCKIAGSVVPRGARCAVLNFPGYANVGDSAIWLGQLEFLQKHDVDVVYTCDVFDYRPQVLAKRIRDGAIVLKGGGAFGDRYLEHQEFRERVIADFPDNPIVQFPQSVEFRDPKRAEQAASALAQHEGLTLLLRDRQSLFRIRDLGLEGTLCPDAAFGLRKLERDVEPSASVVWLARTDGERSVDVVGLTTVDWIRDDPLDRVVHHLPLLRTQRREQLAWRRLQRGKRLLSRGRVVVTDRLHGHILALLLGIPHVLLDTANSKMRHFVDTWTRDCELTHWSDDALAANVAAEQLARAARETDHRNAREATIDVAVPGRLQ